MENYDTVTDALNGLKAKGYINDFNIAYDKIICRQSDFYLHPDEFEITEVYRFEGATSPDDEDVVYAVASKDGKQKGVITSAYGMYADTLSAEMAKKLAMR